ncbi:MAG: hypothetical protein EPN45_13520 [Rhizobiaceae bacterium]|nr:MAG: hypothetical protein EPN45_13520 [Rhizobiaceae bacterium]
MDSEELKKEIGEARQRLADLLDQRVIPAVQLNHAQALAAAYGHTWAVALAMSSPHGVQGEDGWGFMAPAGGIAVTDIREFSEAHGAGPCGLGIDVPTLDADCVIRHTSATGRTSWEVFPDGEVALVIGRPNPADRIEIRIPLTGDGEPSVAVTGELESRHWAAAREAIAAIRGAEEAEDILRAAVADYIARLVRQAEAEIRERVMPAPSPADGVLDSMAELDSTI